jgi:hypothetical protein
MQQLDALTIELPAEVDDRGDIAARVGQAVGETSLDDTPYGDHDDRHRARLGMDRHRIGNSGGDDDLKICRDQLDGRGFALLPIPPVIRRSTVRLCPSTQPSRAIASSKRRRG